MVFGFQSLDLRFDCILIVLSYGRRTGRNGRRTGVKLPSVNHIRNRMCAVEVFKCLNGLAPPDFMEYFQRVKHCKSTRGNEHSLLLPRVKSEAGRKTFAF